MAKTGIAGVRAAWLDAQEALSAIQPREDPPFDQDRHGFKPGCWPGAPAGKLPPDCPVTPLGVAGKISYFVDTLGQLVEIKAKDWSKKELQHLFALTPNFLKWAWPRWGAPKGEKVISINGLEVDDAMQCLIYCAAKKGIFSPMDKVRGRGAWLTSSSELIWHAGDALYRVQGNRLVRAHAGEVDGVFYPQLKRSIHPWQSPVGVADTPIHEIFRGLKSWTWERPVIDPLLVIGWLGCAFLGAALAWRPHIFIVGDRGVGKSTLQHILKGVLGDALHACADTTAAGIYQRVKLDCLPVAVDELEGAANNDKAMKVVALARLASSGALMYRGGSEHEGVEFRLQNAFLFSSINPPPLAAQDRSRMAVLNLGRIAPNTKDTLPVINTDVAGRMILRQLMDGWSGLPHQISQWRETLADGGLNARAQDTYGTLLAVANLLLGDEAMEDSGLPVTDPQRVAEIVARATAAERAEETDNWRLCLSHLFNSSIEAWKNGEKPSVGRVLEEWESLWSKDAANERLLLIGLKAIEIKDEAGNTVKALAIPTSSSVVSLSRLFYGTQWQGGVWGSALKQAPLDVIIRDRGNGQNQKINRETQRCLYLNLAAYDRASKGE